MPLNLDPRMRTFYPGISNLSSQLLDLWERTNLSRLSAISSWKMLFPTPKVITLVSPLIRWSPIVSGFSRVPQWLIRAIWPLVKKSSQQLENMSLTRLKYWAWASTRKENATSLPEVTALIVPLGTVVVWVAFLESYIALVVACLSLRLDHGGLHCNGRPFTGMLLKSEGNGPTCGNFLKIKLRF